MKETAISLLLALLTLFFLEVVSANELSLPFHLPINETFQGINNASAGYQGRCGMQGHGGKCPTELCCSIGGWCGTTSDYCAPKNCQRQCPALYPEGRCGWQADGKSCPTATGQCCSIWGWCGATPDYCAPENCQSHCKLPSPPPPPPSPPPPPPALPYPQCGMQKGGGNCIKTGECCSVWGWCGTTNQYCSPGYCQKQCPGPYPQGRCGWQANGKSCPTGTGQCCSNGGWCGTTFGYCASQNCQSQCNTTTTLTSSLKNRMRGIGSFMLNIV